MTNKEIGNRIKLLREENNMSRQELAANIGIATTTIARYENGEIDRLKLPVIQSIANTLGANPSWIIGKSDDKYIQKKQDLKDAYFNFAAEMQEKEVSEDDMKRLWDFYEMIQNARK